MKKEDCLFCKIINGEIPSSKVYEDENVYCFRDINPQAKVHVLVVPKMHVANVGEAAQVSGLVEKVLSAAVKVARMEGLAEDGYRLVMNTGANGRQSVGHYHVHVLGGELLSDTMA